MSKKTKLTNTNQTSNYERNRQWHKTRVMCRIILKIMFGTKKEKLKRNDHKLFIPPPPPKEVAKVREMLKQVEVWINSGEKELAEKHWMLIADECRKYCT